MPRARRAKVPPSRKNLPHSRKPYISGRVKVHQFLLGVETMTRKITIEQKWHRQSEAAKNEAERLPYGKEREDLLRKARQLDTASHINQWLSSPGLQPPT
jgi:hypothetical protein